ncbi:MAG: hypothetical protein A2017_19245 [Lentisphaerae bacterium GWF2_44_16]|nr:MAG: hypothetical protein A2017_19245 [Lentisphaerae bacterium GWF2_44_16]
MLKGFERIIVSHGISYKIIHMNTKGNDSKEYCEKMALEAKKIIDEYKPDILIASDDPASKYLMMPYYSKSDIPIVFCAVNWDASIYGYPYKNSTGMIEIDFIEETVGFLKKYAKGERMAYICPNDETSRKVAKIYNENFFNGNLSIHIVNDFTEFKKVFLDTQQEADMIILYNKEGIRDWNNREAKDFLMTETKVPTGSNNPIMSEFVLISMPKAPEEFGIFAAEAAVNVLKGKKASDIPVLTNKKTILTVNMTLADKLGIVLPLSVLKTATKIH